jgi:hypothetical protein
MSRPAMTEKKRRNVNDDDDEALPFRDPSVPLAPDQLELRRLVLKEIEAHPDTFDMDDWERAWRLRYEGVCKTTRCLAGWAQYFARGAVNVNGVGTDVDAAGLLGLTEKEYYEGTNDGLFYTTEAFALVRMRQLAAG